MKSARRKIYIEKKTKSKRNHTSFAKFLIPLVILLLGFLFFRLNSHYWNGNDKLSVTSLLESGDVGVTVLDPVLSEVTTLIIPGETEVDVARNYGTFRIKNVMQVGINEKIGGALLSETVSQNFLFPVTLWTGSDTGLADGNPKKLFRFIVCTGKTNIPIGDRIRISIFSLKMQDINRSVINLGKSQYLDKKILSDGGMGYVISGPISSRLTVYFSDSKLSQENIKVNITDATGVSGVSEKVGEIIEVIGGKIVSINRKTSSEDMDCTVTGKSTRAVSIISKLFLCKVVKDESSFDLDIKIGQKFAKRF